MATTISLTSTTEICKNKLALPEGIELGGYRLIRSLGQGGFGITYLAENIVTGQQAVIKENLPSFCAMRDPGTLQVSATNPNDPLQEYPKLLTRFVEEARLLAQLDHPNIVKVQDAFEALGTAYYVMPWLGGKELHKAAPAPADITEAWLQPILRTLLGALQYLHRNNIYHRDVKPANILLTEDGTPVLIDFGTARAIISERSATLVGSPGYSPIEQLRTHGKRGPWTDIYSLGATCYRLITGKNPPEAFDRMDEDEDPLRPLANRAELFERFSPAFLATVDKALALRGKDRWQSTDEWLAALPATSAQQIATTATAAVIDTTRISITTEPPPRKRPHTAIILLILVLALGIPGSYLFYQHGQEKALINAAQNNYTGQLTQLIAAGTNVNAADEYGMTPLLWAARYGHTECVRLLLAVPGIDVNMANEDGDTPLIRAAWEGRTECVRLLLAVPGIDVNMANKDGETPLHKAARNSKPECVKLLLAVPGIDVNKADEDGDTPLNSAAFVGHTECVKLLLAAPDIDVNKANVFGMTPLRAAASGGQTECMRLLLAVPGIDVNKAKDGYTPLYGAAEQGHTECVRLLLAVPGIDVNKATTYGDTPLLWAALHGHAECVKLLLAVPGIDVNKAAKYYGTPLSAAAGRGYTECVRLLLAVPGIDVNKANENDNTPLLWAVSNGHPKCVRLLLAVPGIDVNKADKGGMTPLKVAEKYKHSECARLLRQAGGR